MTNDTASTESTADRTVLDGLAEHTIPLATTNPTADLGDLEALRDGFADARILGLGEATHGTREFFRLKHRFLRYLVTELDVRVFALEANFSETLALDEYVVHGAGDPREALDGIYFWTWKVESVLELVEWLRAFNADRPLADRVRFYGFDAQYSQGAVAELIEYIEAVDAQFLTTVRDDLETVNDEGVPPHQDDDREVRFEAASRVVPTLRTHLHEKRDAYFAERSESAWELALQHVRIIEQAAEFKRAIHDAQSPPDEDGITERTLRVRDGAMADNVDWILTHENPDQMVIWGHDAHVNRVEQTSRQTGVSATSLGGHLADRYGDDYYALGFSFGTGNFHAISENPQTEGEDASYSLREQTLHSPISGTIDATLTELDDSIVVVDVRAARDDERVVEWLANAHEHFSVGATYDPENPTEYITEYVYGDAFDAVCYVHETTASRPL